MQGHGLSTTVRGVRVDSQEEIVDEVALEFPINIYINDKHFVTVFATPHELKEMVIGHLLGYGIATTPDQIKEIIVDGLDILSYLDIEPKELEKRIEKHRDFKLIMTSCGSVEDYLRAFDNAYRPKVNSDFRVTAEKIRSIIAEFGRYSKRSVSVHTAGLYSGVDDRLMGLAMDVSRHITVDKIIGKMVLQGVDFSKSVLLTTGRQASDMVLKAARVGIPITVSLRGPIFSGLYAALKTGVTMVSTVRGRGLTVYSSPERIIGAEQKMIVK
ncbi:MAG: formate dehydrogenase accessory sulfurtransferase FdhD [Candidatus Caldarchaeum sp.]|nr:formate dehydrogenase accessory sulfurtransferase FdhD [Candidatus Caldarchaeum sp.]MDW8063754.1 formate dehydrogenase accessory sulfurtransferase FdhD [Candidatus Caldarchaeum sp.]MDW8434814.1 formate dehydrogenase accessory sulfurtransferase FdhD [Candidatus Caldarchaeum sp.]